MHAHIRTTTGTSKEKSKRSMLYCTQCKRSCSSKHRNDHSSSQDVIDFKVLEECIKDVRSIVSDLERKEKSVIAEIDYSFADLHKVLDDQKQQLKSKAKEMVKEKKRRLLEQERHLCNDYAAVKQGISIELLYSRSSKRSAKDLSNISEKIKKGLGLVEKADLTVEIDCVQDLKQLCQAKAKVGPLPIKCTGKGLEFAQLNEVSQFKLYTYGKSLKQNKPVIMSFLKPRDIECQVEPTDSDGNYCIEYTPTTRGRHKLTVTVNGQEIPGSPFSVFVSIHPKFLGGEPAQTISLNSKPFDLSMSTITGDILVVASEVVTVFYKNRKKQKDLNLSQFDITHPWDVAVDNIDGCVFVCGKKTIVKLTLDYKFAKIFQGGEGSKYTGMTVVKDELMVCCGNTLAVFTKDLQLTREIGDSLGTFTDVCSSENNIYVSDYCKRCIKVFSNCGEFLSSFGRRYLHHPRGLCVTKEYIYVANRRGHCVTTFTTKGEYVASFGEHDSNRKASGVCTDQDGFVYVCDQGSNAILKF